MRDFHEAALHRRSRADEQRRGLARRRGCGGRGVGELADGLLHFVQIQRLHEIGRRAELPGGDRVIEIPMRGDDERGQAGRALAELCEHVEPAHVGQADVEDREREVAARQLVEPALAAGAGARLVPEPLAHARQRARDGVFVFDDEDGFHAGMAGSWRVTTAPPSGALATSSAPPWARKISVATLRPMPMPPSFSEKKSSE